MTDFRRWKAFCWRNQLLGHSEYVGFVLCVVAEGIRDESVNRWNMRRIEWTR